VETALPNLWRLVFRVEAGSPRWFGIGLGGATRERSGQRCSVVEKIGRRLSEEFAVHPSAPVGARWPRGTEGTGPNGPILATIGPVVRVEFERVEALDSLG